MSKRREFFVTLFLALFSLNSFADTYTWKSATSGTFSDVGNWLVSSSDGEEIEATEGEGPGEDDDVIIPSGTAAYTVTIDKAFKVKSLEVGNNADASATVTLEATHRSTSEIIEGMIVGTKGVLTHTAGYRLNIIAGGDIIINGTVNVAKKGASTGSAPKEGSGNGYISASHGGHGSKGGNVLPKIHNPYGSIRNPTALGSSGGGGAVYLFSRGNIEIRGSGIDASAGGTQGSGGSILLKAKKIISSSDATISAKGGTNSWSGGGGRIALYQTEAVDWNEHKAETTAKHGGKGSSGTVYKEHANNAPGEGALSIEGANGTWYSAKDSSGAKIPQKYATYLATDTLDDGQPFGSVYFSGKVVVKNGATLRVRNSITATTQLTTEEGGAIELVPLAGKTCKISGKITSVDSFICNSPGATIAFAADAEVSIKNEGNIILRGSQENYLKLCSQTSGKTWKMSIGAIANVDASLIDISSCNASGSTVSFAVKDSIGENNTNVEFSSSAKPGDPMEWTGINDTTWSNSSNWKDKNGDKRVPNETDVITIPTESPNFPELTSQVTVNSLIIEEGATIKLTGANLTVTNSLSCAGAITRANAGQLVIAGEGDATLDFGDGEYGDVHITKSGGKVVLPNGVKAKRLKIVSSTDTVFEVQAGKTIEADVFDVDGTNGAFENRHLTFASSVPGSYWKLKVNGVMRVRGVNVSDSDASSGREIAAGDFVTGINQNNLNWNFNSESAVEWVGGTDSNWTTPENWLPGGVPGKDAVVSIRPKDVNVSVTLSSADLIVPVGGLILGGSSHTATLTCNKAIEVAGSLDVAENTTLVLNSIATNNIVGKDVIVRPSATITHTGPRYSNTQLNGINLYVKGDMVVEKNAKVNADGKGFATGYGPSKGWKVDSTTMAHPSHGGMGNKQSATTCYGSILRPRTFGSPNYDIPDSSESGGGQIAITAEGDFLLDGNISANGGASAGGSGGSVYLEASTLRGVGKISADGMANIYGAAGGRIAICLTEATSLGLTGGVTASAAGGGYSAAGTRYYKFAGKEGGGGTMYFNPGNSRGTAFPMADDGNPRVAYAKETLDLSSGTLYLLKDATVYDLNLTGGILNLQGHTLRVISRAHKDGKGWTGGYANRVTENGGEIIWIGGFSIKVR